MKNPKTFSDIKNEFRSDLAKIKEDFRRDTAKIKSDYQRDMGALPVGAKLFLFTLCAIFGFIFLFGIFGPSNEERFCDETKIDHSFAYASAQVFVRRQLREPDSAEMPPEAVASTWLGNCTFRVMGSVRARNGFGGYVQNMYSVTVRYDPATDTFRYADFSMF